MNVRLLYSLPLLVGLFLKIGFVHAADPPDATITNPNTVVNRYAALALDAYRGDTSIHIFRPGGTTVPEIGTVQPGDILFLYQAQGASMKYETDTHQPLQDSSYGSLLSLGGAGWYEWVTITKVDIEGNHLFFDTSCGGLKHPYQALKTQVLLVPQYNRLTVNANASITAPPWDGTRGGIVAIKANTILLASGAKINVSGLGFRGGVVHAAPGDTKGANMSLYVSSDPNAGGEKGEGVVGDASQYDAFLGRYGRGAPANGGGGGDGHRAGGGGGSNGNRGTLWTGQGTMSSAYAPAWKWDPAYIANFNRLTDSAGGGRGGYSSSSACVNPLTTGPNQAAWGSDFRREVGGLGGHPLPTSVGSERLFFGGGGGAGDGDSKAGSGGAGGGIVFLMAQQINGIGSIEANGSPGQAAQPVSTEGAADGPGGGGGGGTIFIMADQLRNLALSAQGGEGGAHQTQASSSEANGGGGGGSGGRILVPSGSMVSTNVSGGQAGQTNVSSLSSFPFNGATDGSSGTFDLLPDWSPGSQTCRTIDLAISVEASQLVFSPDQTLSMQVTVLNASSQSISNATVRGNVDLPFPNIFWKCITPDTCQSTQGMGTLQSQVSLPIGGLAVFKATIPPWGGTKPPASQLTYTASVEAPSSLWDANPTNNTAQATSFFAGTGQFPFPWIEQGTAPSNPQKSEYRYTGGLGCNMAPPTGGYGLLEIILCAFLLVGNRLVYRLRRHAGTTKDAPVRPLSS